MVHGVVPSYYDTVTTKTAKTLKEHVDCLGILKLEIDFTYGRAEPIAARCLKCRKDNFPQTIEEMKRKIMNVRQSVQYE
jgi:hypothetical protein